MKRFIQITSLILGSFFLVIFLLLFFQTSSNIQAAEIRVKKSWTETEFNGYFKKEFDIALPKGMAYWAGKVGYNIQTSRFVIPPNASVYSIIRLLRINRNQTVNIVIPPGIYITELQRILLKNFDIEEEDLEAIWKDDSFWSQFDVNSYTWPTLIIPNTYNFSRNTEITDFFERMKNEQLLFWNTDRKAKLRNQKLDINEATAIASIVQKESLKTAEYEKIAGVYINRFRINMYLGADPTLVFIKGKGGRVYKKDMKIESPYNTYINKGLPPGPICLPSKAAIEAVLNYTEHPYLYFCAKSDLSGYHAFTRHYKDHLVNARLFQKKLDELEHRKAKR